MTKTELKCCVCGNPVSMGRSYIKYFSYGRGAGKVQLRPAQANLLCSTHATVALDNMIESLKEVYSETNIHQDRA